MQYFQSNKISRITGISEAATSNRGKNLRKQNIYHIREGMASFLLRLLLCYCVCSWKMSFCKRKQPSLEGVS